MIEIDSVTTFEAFIKGIIFPLAPAMPIIIPIILSKMVVSIIKMLLCNLWDFFNFASSKRETRRAHKDICNAVEGVSSLMDLADAAKKK